MALMLAVRKLMQQGKLAENPVREAVAAVSVGVVRGAVLLDLCYEEDAAASVDMNLVMNGRGEFVEMQGSGEESTFTEGELAVMLELGKKGIQELLKGQALALSEGTP